MRRFDPYSRRKLQRLRKDWVRGNAGVVSLVVLGIVLLGAVASLLVVAMWTGAARWYSLGVLHAGLLAVGLHLLHSVFLVMDRQALRHVRGAWGEDNTRSELRRAKRRRLVWGWVDSINLEAGDLDHVAMSRRGGLVVLDSKWRNHVTADDASDMARSAHKARARAEAPWRD